MQLLLSFLELNGCRLSPGSCLSCPSAQPLHGWVIPGGKLLKCLLSVRVAATDSGLRKGALGVPGDGGGAVDRGTDGRTADLRGCANEGHLVSQLAGVKLQRGA